MLLALVLLAAAPAPSQAAEPELDAAAWLLLDRRDGEVLAAHQQRSRRAIASTTKLMTALVARKRLRLRERVRMPAYDANPVESLAGLKKGEKLTVEDLLYALLLASANDAAKALAVASSGSVERFVGEMNREARANDLDATVFANPIGLDQKGNHSSAADLADLAELVLADRRLRRIVATPEYEMRSGDQVRVITTTNELMLSDPSVDGVKTGHTADAGYVLIASAERSGVSLLSVVMGAPSEAARDAESAELLAYGFSRYRTRRPVRRGAELASPGVRYEDEPLPLVAPRAIRVSARDDQKIEVAIDAPTEVEGPIEAGKRLGAAVVRLDGRVVGRTPLRAGRAVAAPGLIDRIGGPLVAIVAIAVVLVILLLIARSVRGHGSRHVGSRSPEERARSREARARRRNGKS